MRHTTVFTVSINRCACTSSEHTSPLFEACNVQAHAALGQERDLIANAAKTLCAPKNLHWGLATGLIQELQAEGTGSSNRTTTNPMIIVPGRNFEQFWRRLRAPSYDQRLGLFQILGEITLDFRRHAPEIQAVLAQIESRGWPNSLEIDLPDLDSSRSHRRSSHPSANGKLRFRAIISKLNRLIPQLRFRTIDSSSFHLNWEFTDLGMTDSVAKLIRSEIIGRCSKAIRHMHNQQSAAGVACGELLQMGAQAADLLWLHSEGLTEMNLLDVQVGTSHIPGHARATLSSTGARLFHDLSAQLPTPVFDLSTGELRCGNSSIAKIGNRAFATHSLLKHFQDANWQRYIENPILALASPNRRAAKLKEVINNLHRRQESRVIQLHSHSGGRTVSWKYATEPQQTKTD